MHHTRSRVPASVAIALLAVAACTAAPTTPSATAPSGTSPESVPPASGGGTLVAVRPASNPGGIAIADLATGTILATYPQAVIQGSTAWTVGAADGRTTVEAIDVRDGGTIASRTFDGEFALPAAGRDGASTGISADGSRLVLVHAAAGPTTELAILRGDLGADPVFGTLAGRFAFDALDPAGTIAYVLEYARAADPDGYAVRAVDLGPPARLRDGTIVDKREAEAVMSGVAVVAATGPDGWLFTLYRGPAHFFVHALQTRDGFAFCIDLPEAGGRSADLAGWSIAVAPGGGRFYVANIRRGVVHEIDGNDLVLTRTARVGGTAVAAAARAADGGDGSDGSGGSGGIAVSADGSTILVGGSAGIARIRAVDLAALPAIDLGGRVVDLAPAGDGILLALLADGVIVSVDEATGRAVGRTRLAGSAASGIVATIQAGG